MKVALLVDGLKVIAGAFKGFDEFLTGLGGKGLGVKPDGDGIAVVWVLRFGAKLERMSGGK
jgi:hypothetical protein